MMTCSAEWIKPGDIKVCKVEGSKLNEFGSVRLELRLYNDKTIVSYTIHNNNIGGGVTLLVSGTSNLSTRSVSTPFSCSIFNK